MVRHLEAEYLAPAYFDDVLAVETDLVEITGSRIILAQRVVRDGVALFAAKVTLVCVAEGRAVRVPGDVAALLA